MFHYQFACVITEPAPGEFVVRFPAVPEALTGGGSREEAYANARDALDTALTEYLDRGMEIPARGQTHIGELLVSPSPAVAARAELLRAMREQGLTKVALAERLGRDEKVARRIVAGSNVSLELMLHALRAVGVEPQLGFERPVKTQVVLVRSDRSTRAWRDVFEHWRAALRALDLLEPSPEVVSLRDAASSFDQAAEALSRRPPAAQLN